MSTRPLGTVLRCDQTTPDPQNPAVDLRCQSEMQSAGDEYDVRDAASRLGWGHVRSGDTWLDICPACYPRLTR